MIANPHHENFVDLTEMKAAKMTMKSKENLNAQHSPRGPVERMPIVKPKRKTPSFSQLVKSSVSAVGIGEDLVAVVNATFGFEGTPPDLHAGLFQQRKLVADELTDRALNMPQMDAPWCAAELFDERWATSAADCCLNLGDIFKVANILKSRVPHSIWTVKVKPQCDGQNSHGFGATLSGMLIGDVDQRTVEAALRLAAPKALQWTSGQPFTITALTTEDHKRNGMRRMLRIPIPATALPREQRPAAVMQQAAMLATVPLRSVIKGFGEGRVLVRGAIAVAQMRQAIEAKESGVLIDPKQRWRHVARMVANIGDGTFDLPMMRTK